MASARERSDGGSGSGVTGAGVVAAVMGAAAAAVYVRHALRPPARHAARALPAPAPATQHAPATQPAPAAPPAPLQHPFLLNHVAIGVEPAIGEEVRPYLYAVSTDLPPAPARPPAPQTRPVVWWHHPVRMTARIGLVGAALAAAVVLPLSTGTHPGAVEASWPPRDIGSALQLATTPGATVGTGVRLAAASQPDATAVATQYGGGHLTPIPAPVLAAYQLAASRAATTYPQCSLTWPVLAGIGEIESGHVASAGALRRGWNGVATPPVLGPVLDGAGGRARIADTDNGRLDGDPHYDRAVGPMQFLPGTWATYGVDGNSDGKADPQNIYDATATAARYLCDGDVNLGDPLQLARAIDSYNHADWYVRAVMAAAAGYLAESYGRSQMAVAQAAIAFAYAHLGDPYEFGGTGPRYDCSGLTMAAYATVGVQLPRTSEQQWQALPHVDPTQLQPGDLVFFNAGEFVPGLPGHVGIYLGDGYMIDDPHTGAFVRIEKVDGFGQLVGAARPSLLSPTRGAPTPGSALVISPAGTAVAEPPGSVASPPEQPAPIDALPATPSSADAGTVTPLPVPAPTTNPDLVDLPPTVGSPAAGSPAAAPDTATPVDTAAPVTATASPPTQTSSTPAPAPTDTATTAPAPSTSSAAPEPTLSSSAPEPTATVATDSPTPSPVDSPSPTADPTASDTASATPTATATATSTSTDVPTP